MNKLFYAYKAILFLCLILNTCFHSKAQHIFYQDIFKGGITGGGYTATTSSGTGNFNLFIPPGSTIQYAFFLAGCYGNPDPIKVLLNSEPYIFNQSNKVYDKVYSPYTGKASVHSIDLINSINPNISNYTITIPQQQNSILNSRYTDFYLIVGYKNSTLPNINSVIAINDKDFTPNIKYNIKNINAIDLSNQVGYALMTGFICDTIQDGSAVLINNIPIGLIGGYNYNSLGGCGVFGFFYYQNNQLFGLGNSIANTTMTGNDGIANISPYLNNQDSISILFEQQEQSFPDGCDNSIWANFLTYTSPCDTFTTKVTPDTTLCHGKTLQLQASGGQSYEWAAMTDSVTALGALSCTDCPNPVFSGDSSQVYTVRIWNTDSCSVVKPVRIGVSHPQEINAKMFRSICSFSTGKILVEDLPDNVVQLGAVNPDGDTISPTSGNDFTGLAAGDYTVFYIDKFDCSADTLIYVEPVISTIAQFNAYPKKGTAPLYINIDNQSQNATDYSWWINDIYQGNSFSGFYTDTSGTYNIELIAWKNDSICADTASFTVFVYDSLVVTLPNVFTPNNDGTNDYFNVKVNLPVSYKLNILNRWGNLVFEKAGDLTQGTHDLWNGRIKNGELVTDGTYFYTISFALDSQLVDCEITDCKVEKEGFVHVFGE